MAGGRASCVRLDGKLCERAYYDVFTLHADDPEEYEFRYVESGVMEFYELFSGLDEEWS